MNLQEVRNILRDLKRSLTANTSIKLAAKFKPAPGGPKADYPPSGINPGANKIWKLVLQKYSKSIYKSSKASKQWAQAVFVFVKSCRKREIEPYLVGVRRRSIVTKALKKFINIIQSHNWKGTKFYSDFDDPYIHMTYKGDQAAISVNLRGSPSVYAKYKDSKGKEHNKSFGKLPADKEDLETQFTKALAWLEGEG